MDKALLNTDAFGWGLNNFLQTSQERGTPVLLTRFTDRKAFTESCYSAR